MIVENEKDSEQRNLTDKDNNQRVLRPWQPNEIPTAFLFESVCNTLGGTSRSPGEDKSFDTEEHGIVTHQKISRICIDKFGAESKRNERARYLEFNTEKLIKAKAAYIFPEKVEILQKNIPVEEERGDDDVEDGDDKAEGLKNVREFDPDANDVNDEFRSRQGGYVCFNVLVVKPFEESKHNDTVVLVCTDPLVQGVQSFRFS
jgi:hypothetical protein